MFNFLCLKCSRVFYYKDIEGQSPPAKCPDCGSIKVITEGRIWR